MLWLEWESKNSIWCFPGSLLGCGSSWRTCLGSLLPLHLLYTTNTSCVGGTPMGNLESLCDIGAVTIRSGVAVAINLYLCGGL